MQSYGLCLRMRLAPSHTRSTSESRGTLRHDGLGFEVYADDQVSGADDPDDGVVCASAQQAHPLRRSSSARMCAMPECHRRPTLRRTCGLVAMFLT